MFSGYSGDWLFKTPYTNFPQEGLLTYLPYLILGKLTSPPAQQEQMIALFHLFRVFSGLLMVGASYAFISLFIKKIVLRRWATALAVLGGGLGWLLIVLGKSDLFGSLPLEFYSPESFGFLSLFSLPHLALARALLLWGLLWYLKEIPQASKSSLWQKDKVGIKIGLLWLFMGFFQPLYIVVGIGLITAHLLALSILAWRKTISWNQCIAFSRRLIWIAIVSAPMLVYNLIIFSTDPFAKAWTAQNTIASPHIFHYLLAYILLLPFAFMGLKRFYSTDRIRASFFLAWGLVLPFWVYAPVSVQRRLAEGFWVALVISAIYYLDAQKEKPLWFQKPSILLFGFISTLFILIGATNQVLVPNEPLFRKADEISFYQDIRGLVEEKSTILASFKTSNLLPAYLPVQVIIGHGPESINHQELLPQVERFYSAGIEAYNQDLLSNNNVDYLIWGPHEQSLGNFKPHNTNYLSLVYENNGYYLFEVTDLD